MDQFQQHFYVEAAFAGEKKKGKYFAQKLPLILHDNLRTELVGKMEDE